MRPFDLQEYLKNPDRQIVTRDGRSARIICTDGSNKKYPIIALMQSEDGKDALTYTIEGRNIDGHICPLDLFFEPEPTTKKEGWINVSRIGTVDARKITFAGSVYPTKEEALAAGKNYEGYIDTIKIQWEE